MALSVSWQTVSTRPTLVNSALDLVDYARSVQYSAHASVNLKLQPTQNTGACPVLKPHSRTSAGPLFQQLHWFRVHSSFQVGYTLIRFCLLLKPIILVCSLMNLSLSCFWCAANFWAFTNQWICLSNYYVYSLSDLAFVCYLTSVALANRLLAPWPQATRHPWHWPADC